MSTPPRNRDVRKTRVTYQLNLRQEPEVKEPEYGEGHTDDDERVEGTSSPDFEEDEAQQMDELEEEQERWLLENERMREKLSDVDRVTAKILERLGPE